MNAEEARSRMQAEAGAERQRTAEMLTELCGAFAPMAPLVTRDHAGIAPETYDDWQNEVVAECHRLGVSVVVDDWGRVSWHETSNNAFDAAMSARTPEHRRLHLASAALWRAVPLGAGVRVENGERMRTEEQIAADAMEQWRRTAPRPESGGAPS